MQIKEFRGDEFINRENEINFIKNWVSKIPKEILWIFGPKSTGKTTLIEYVIEKEFLKSNKYSIKYINFRSIFDKDRMFIYWANSLYDYKKCFDNSKDAIDEIFKSIDKNKKKYYNF